VPVDNRSTDILDDIDAVLLENQLAEAEESGNRPPWYAKTGGRISVKSLAPDVLADEGMLPPSSAFVDAVPTNYGVPGSTFTNRLQLAPGLFCNVRVDPSLPPDTIAIVQPNGDATYLTGIATDRQEEQ
jgi:hypothetical protein